MFYYSVWKTDRRRHHVPIIDLIGCRCSQKSCAGIDMFRLSLPRDRAEDTSVIGRQTATAKKTNISSTANAPPIFCRPWLSTAKRKPRFYAIGTPRPSHKSGRHSMRRARPRRAVSRAAQERLEGQDERHDERDRRCDERHIDRRHDERCGYGPARQAARRD